MENFRVSFSFMFVSLIFLMFPASLAQLAPSESRILFQIQKLLEYPAVLQGWNNWTNFCYLPTSTSLRIVCSDNHVTELTIVGNRTSSPTKKTATSGQFSVSQQTLSGSFSIDSFFTVLSKLTNAKKLSLVSLGLWGPLPAKIKRFGSLEVLNVSSNFISGQIPQEIVSMKILTSLVLADNLLNGSVPDLKSLPFLQELNLGGNNLGPKFPSLGNNLTTIILSKTSLRSEIPASIKNLKQLQKLDVSSNKLIGPIPPALFSLPSLQFLDLAQNQLTGALSANISCSAKLQFVDISHNLLIGKLPSCIASNSSNRTIVSSWNCLASGNANYQHPYSFCQKEALAVKPTSTTEKKDSSIKLGIIIGIIGGVVGIVAILALLIVIIARRSETKETEHRKYEGSVSDKMSFRSYAVPAIDSKRVPQTMRSAAIGLPPYRILTLEEIEDATSNFDQENLTGEGPQGEFYKGWLRDGLLVLIRSVKLKQKHSPQSLKQQMEVLSKLRHVHLVSVLGHCIVTYQDRPSTTTAIYVVLENISNGSLRDYLTDRRKREMLKWPQRMAITIGIARGIQFLHSGVSPGLFGNNVKIENVLLDETLTAKLSNYCIPLPSKMGSESPLSGQEIHNDHNCIENPEKEDVYQFGVILVQVITGKIVTSTRELDELKVQLEKGLAEPPSKLRGLVDPSTLGSFAYESMRNTVEIALNCLARDHRSRPSIDDVLWNLQYSIQVQEGWTSSGNLGLQS